MAAEEQTQATRDIQAERLALDKAVQQTVSGIKNKLMVLSGKGGVGKSTVAVNLAISLGKRGLTTGLLDVDLHGPSVPNLMGLGGRKFGIREEFMKPVDFEGLVKVASMGFALRRETEAVIWRGPLKIGAMKQFIGQVGWGRLDYLVVDSPPGTGDEPLTIAQVMPDARGLIVTTPQEVALADVRKSVSFCRAVSMDIAGVIENMSGLRCPHCEKEIELFPVGGGEKMARQMGVPFLGRLRIDPELVKSGDEGRPYVLHYLDAPLTKDFEAIVDKLLAQQG